MRIADRRHLSYGKSRLSRLGENSMKFRKERLDRGIKARCEDIFALSSYREILYLMFPRVLPVLSCSFFRSCKELLDCTGKRS